MGDQRIRVLLVEDDEDDYTLVKSLLDEARSPGFTMKWATTYEMALKEMCSDQFDICLVDYRLGGKTGIQLLESAKQRGMVIPAILLTGYGDFTLDLQAMRAGATDYLEKEAITSALLERTLRYAIENTRANKALRELSRKILSTQEDERKYLAKELHDSIGSSLTAIKFVLERKLDAMKKGKSESEKIQVEDIISMVQNAVKETKRIQKALRPPVLDDLGLIAALRSLCREFQEIHRSVEIQTSFRMEERDMPEDLKIVIFRISQEALSNIAKHSKAARIRVSLHKNGDDLEFVIEDNGSGFDPEEVLERGRDLEGMGILSMRERAQISGGSFQIASSKGRGTTIRVSWPPELLVLPQCLPPEDFKV